MNGHPTRDEDFDLYALGALEGAEKQALESHVAFCIGCAQKLADARGRIALLAFAAPQVKAPAIVKERLLQQIRAPRERSGAGLTEMSPRGASRTVLSRWTAILLPIAAVLAIATFLLWNANRQLDGQLAALRRSAQLQEQQLQDAREIATLITAHDTITVPLAPQPAMPQGMAHVMYNAKMGMLMYEGEIPPAPSAKSYQLWLVPASGNPISCGVFNPVSGQPDHWMMKLPKGIDPKAFAVTLEPSGGMPQPTGPKVLIGAAS
jgi:anti-sigma-K factor RskA